MQVDFVIFMRTFLHDDNSFNILNNGSTIMFVCIVIYKV